MFCCLEGLLTMNKREKELLLEFTQASLRMANLPKISENDYAFLYNEFKFHTILGLPANIIKHMHNIPIEVQQKWEQDIYSILYTGFIYKQRQDELIKILQANEIKFVILKGTSASQYYKFPELRMMGDIDLMPIRKQFDKTCEILQNAGYTKMAYNPPYKCMVLHKDNISVEVHRYFAKMNDPQKAELLDSMILENITGESVYLPDAINGLVLLQHIDHHLENGVGLRQIIDWYMFVKSFLSDEVWDNSFSSLVNNLGLEKLAKILTRLCQIYLGLDIQINWCTSADCRLCENLMNYILESGNFGNKNKRQEKAIQKAFFDIRHPVLFFQQLQKHGNAHIKQDQITSWPSAFAWCYQLIHSIRQTIVNHISLVSIMQQAFKARKKKMLLDKLEVKQEIKGLVIYENGKYVKH